MFDSGVSRGGETAGGGAITPSVGSTAAPTGASIGASVAAGTVAAGVDAQRSVLEGGVQALTVRLRAFTLAGINATTTTAAPTNKPGTAPTSAAASTRPDAEEVDAWRVGMLTELEALKSVICAAQARLAAQLASSQRAHQRAAGVPAKQCGRGVAAQVALARGESPHHGGKLLGAAEALLTEMPHTLTALAHGSLNEWRAMLLIRESACLTRTDRALLDQQISGDHHSLRGVGDRRLVARARTFAQRLDAAALVRRARRAETERTVTLRPAPDLMTYLTALLPMKDGIAAYTALRAAADTAVSTGHATSRGQAMADTLVARLTGRAPTDPVPVHVGLVMTDTTLLAPDGTPGAEEPATLTTPGLAGTPVPAPWARTLIHTTLTSTRSSSNGTSDAESSTSTGDAESSTAAANGGCNDREVGVWLRRLFRDPSTGELAAMDSRSRCAPPNLARFIRYRDTTCRTPWCDAPIRHIDHITPANVDGPTTATNLQGLCEACNHAKQAPDWTQRVTAGDGASPRAANMPDAAHAPTHSRSTPDSGEASAHSRSTPDSGEASMRSRSDAPDTTTRHTVETRTPTGHRYYSTAPPLPGGTVDARPRLDAEPGDRAERRGPTGRKRDRDRDREPAGRQPEPPGLSGPRCDTAVAAERRVPAAPTKRDAVDQPRPAALALPRRTPVTVAEPRAGRRAKGEGILDGELDDAGHSDGSVAHEMISAVEHYLRCALENARSR